jgi:hypothetical protein
MGRIVGGRNGRAYDAPHCDALETRPAVFRADGRTWRAGGTSEEYSSADAMEQAIAAVKRVAPTASLDDRT